jgi:membrane protein DedA with SNARE-associated domain
VHSGDAQIEPLTDLIHALETFVLTFSGDVYDFMGWFGVIVLMSIESTAIPLPSEVIMPLAGWRLVLDKGHGVPYVFLAGFYGAVGSLIGSLAEYYLARVGGRPLIEKYGKYFLITRKDLERADSWFKTRGELTVFIARMIPGVRGFISIPAGIARMNVPRFALFTFLGAFPWTLGLAWGGFLLGENYDGIRDVSKPFDIPIIATVLVIVIWFVWHRIKEIRAESALSENTTD